MADRQIPSDVVPCGEQVSVVVTTRVVRGPEGLGRRCHVQILDTRSVPARLYDPNVIHDGSRDGAISAAARWWDGLGEDASPMTAASRVAAAAVQFDRGVISDIQDVIDAANVPLQDAS